MMDTKKIISSYSRFIPHQLIDLLGKHSITELALGLHVEKKLTVMFSDIRNFTSLSETLTPQETFSFINSYLSQMVPLISVNDGIIDKYIGDAIMAIFPGKADDAVRCALQILKQLNFYNEGRMRAGYKPIAIGIGINTGMAMIGTVGGYNRMSGTVISDAVNVASRMETMTKRYNVDLLISEGTYNNIGDTYKPYIRFVDRTRVKGKMQPQSIYEVFYQNEKPLREQKHANKKIFEEAMAHYHLKDIGHAETLLRECQKDNHDDNPAQIYLERCSNFEKLGFHEGAYELTKKIEWSDIFLIQEEQIDNHHYGLVTGSLELIELAYQGKRDEYKNKLDELEHLAINHFQYEEKVMEASNYPFFESQKEQHQYMASQFEVLKKEAHDSSMSMPFLTFRTQIILVDWLVNHTLKEDKHLGKHLAVLKMERE